MPLVRLDGEESPAAAARARAARPVRTFQITQLGRICRSRARSSLNPPARRSVDRCSARSIPRCGARRGACISPRCGSTCGRCAPVELAYASRLVEIALALALKPKVMVLVGPMAVGRRRRAASCSTIGVCRGTRDLIIEHDRTLSSARVAHRRARRRRVLAEGKQRSAITCGA